MIKVQSFSLNNGTFIKNNIFSSVDSLISISASFVDIQNVDFIENNVDRYLCSQSTTTKNETLSDF